MQKTVTALLLRGGFIVCMLISMMATAQEPTLKQVKERQELAKQALEDAQLSSQNPAQIGNTPLSSMLALAKAIRSNDYLEAQKYFDFRILADSISVEQKTELIKQLDIVWSQHHSLDITTLSDEPQGHLDDGLPSYRDLLGVIDSSIKDVPIYLQRVKVENGKQIWKISSKTVGQIPELWSEFGYHPIAESVGEYLPEFHIFDMQNWQFVSFIIILVCSWYLTDFIRYFLIKLVSYSEVYRRTMRRFIRVPLRLFLFFIFLQWATGHLGLSIYARVWLDTGTLNYLASIFLSMGIIEFCFALYVSRASQDNNSVVILKPMVTTLKIITVIVIALNWFKDAGFNITAIITGLGIGSLAIALAAQKSLENVFGAFTLFVARPIKPGDMCKFGNTQGRVEEIGLRSTKIRKLDRKVVHVPNSTIASMELENISEIDNRRYLKRLRIRLNTPTDKLKALVEAIRKLIDEHPNTTDLERYVRFEDIEEDAFIVVVNAYSTVSGRVQYKEIEEKINFQIMQIIDQHKVELAIPEQRLSMNDLTKPA
ncbi:mechanosensitive ion channel family protein [Thalassotalea nanhaiensis]|uniref:Mechanosensitive ion channel family protein n=1 Tax=Thalassotalea nanhaiensis TaxID=3065648 RepID=A0ABY9TJ40_9GAMM|nr:mechanosensitive ion channel family protein [Colwelliaceae bacterium SQ345]